MKIEMWSNWSVNGKKDWCFSLFDFGYTNITCEKCIWFNICNFVIEFTLE